MTTNVISNATRTQMINFIHENLTRKDGKKILKTELKAQSDENLRKICANFAEDFVEYLETTPVKLQKFFAECTDANNVSVVVTQQAIDIEDCKQILEENGYSYTRLVQAKGHHLCKYCHKIANGTNKDVLCDNCKYIFGHTLYNEL